MFQLLLWWALLDRAMDKWLVAALGRAAASGRPPQIAHRYDDNLQRPAGSMAMLIAKLALKNALEIRELQSAVLVCWVLPKESEFALPSSNATRLHYEKVQAAKKKNELGPAHVHHWAALCTVANSATSLDQSERDTLAMYIQAA